jgi:23S rRNA pseudouridine1911/1915/1917 synthase
MTTSKKAPFEALVPLPLKGSPLDAVVRALFEATWGDARKWIETGKITVDGDVTTDVKTRVRAGSSVRLSMNAPKPRGEGDLEPERIVHLDGHVVVVDKPPGISTVPFDETDLDTLDARVRAHLARTVRSTRTAASRPSLGVVHRLDKETSGLLVFARSWLAKQSLSRQFRFHTVERRYIALVHGALRKQTFRSHLIADRGDGLRGSIEQQKARGKPMRGIEGQLAVTHVDVLERLPGATLVHCRLETGRTHQIRIHLSEAGHPLVGERVYIRGFDAPRISAPRLMLHAEVLGFSHPQTEETLRFERPMPSDMKRVLARLREGGTA